MFDKSKARLPDLCADAFAFATQIRGAQEPESFAAFRQRVDALYCRHCQNVLPFIPASPV